MRNVAENSNSLPYLISQFRGKKKKKTKEEKKLHNQPKKAHMFQGYCIFKEIFKLKKKI